MNKLSSSCLMIALLSAQAKTQTIQDAPQGLEARDWQEIHAAYDRGRHALLEVGDTHQAHNPGQRWGLAFDGRGFLVEPSAGSWSWGLELVSYGLRGDERPVERPTEACADGVHLTYVWDSTLEEWYHNDARGLEHGFTVWQRPIGHAADDPAADLSFTLRVRGELRPEVTGDGRDVRFVDATGDVQVTYSGLTVLDADGRELEASFAATGRLLDLRVQESGARYPLTIDPVALQAYLKASNTEAGDGFGGAVAVWGDTVAIGARGEDSATTGVNGDETNNGAPDSGGVYVFTRSGSTWSQQAYIKASNTDPDDGFGGNLALHGDTLAVGAVGEDSALANDESDNSAPDAGAVYVFTRQGSTWTQEAYLKASNPDPEDGFGVGIALSGSTIAVGAWGEDSNAAGVNGDESDNSLEDAGAVYVFTRGAGVWTQQAYLKPQVPGFRLRLGPNLDLDGETLVAGATWEHGAATGVNGDATDQSALAAGAAYVFVRSGTVWNQQAYLKASNTDAGDYFGTSVALSGDTIAVGAYGEDSSSGGVNGNQGNQNHYPDFDAGAVYVFVRSGTTWSQEAYVKASTPRRSEGFCQVWLAGDALAVGCFAERVDLFHRDQGTWTEDFSLRSPNPSGFATYYGIRGGMSGSTYVVGDLLEDSGATGVNGDAQDTSADNAGAAYVYELPDPLEACHSLPNATGAVARMHCLGLPNSGLTLISQPVPNTIGQFFYGSMILAGTPFGDGVLCVGGMTQRMLPFIHAGMMMQVPNRAHLVINYAAPYAAGLTGTQYFQHWFRSGLTTGSGFNTSSSIAVTF